jgi:hypothetical protein
MEDGSCCGKWGIGAGAEGCAKQPRCTQCYDDKEGASGYRAYFNAKEFDFARTVGEYWTNMAASGDPNTRNARVGGDGGEAAAVDTPLYTPLYTPPWSSSLPQWPGMSAGDTAAVGVVLSADLPGGAKAEYSLYGDPKVCAFWDSVDAAGRAAVGDVEA